MARHVVAAALVRRSPAGAARLPPPSPQRGRGSAGPLDLAAPDRSSLGTIRVGAADNNIWFGWRVGVPTTAAQAA